jgi:hypothetical protein
MAWAAYQAAQPRATANCATVTIQPPCIDLHLYEGDDFRMDLVCHNPDGSYADLSMCTAAAQIRNLPFESARFLSFDCSIGQVAGIGNWSVVHLLLPSDQSAGLGGHDPLSEYDLLYDYPMVWDCQLAYPEIVTICRGNVTSTRQVTQ